MIPGCDRLREWRHGQGDREGPAQPVDRAEQEGAPRLPHRGHLRGRHGAQGTEVKSLRAGRASLVDGFVDLDNGEVWLHGVHIPEYAQGTWTNHAARRKRKLLLNRAEINKLERKVGDKGYTIVPLSLYFKDGRAKVEIALARGKKEYDKRHSLAERQANREKEQAVQRRLKGYTD